MITDSSHRNKVVFAAFDDHKGPVPIFSTIEKSISNKVAIKSIVTTLSAQEGKDKEKIEGEAIVPFPDEKLLGFIYYFSLNSLNQKTVTGDFRICSVTLLTPASLANQLYATAADLSTSAREIGALINKSYIFGESISNELKKAILDWGTEEKVEIVPELELEEAKLTLSDLYSHFLPVTGFKLRTGKVYEDPLSYALLAFLNQIPVVLSGPDPKYLFGFANIFQDLFHLKELQIELTIPVISKFASQKIQKIPRTDIILLTDEQFKKSYFSGDPITILTTHQEFKTPYHKFEEVDLKRIADWLKKSREMKKEEQSQKVIRVELDRINDKLNQLVYLAISGSKSNFKEVCKILESDREELEFLIRQVLFSRKCSANQLNKLLSPETHYIDVEFRLKDTMGMVNV